MLTYNVYFKPVFIITYFTKIVNKFLIEFVPILYIFRHFPGALLKFYKFCTKAVLLF